ncbi:hypothetical protein ACROYT_G016310 [Oculina patagonica]
MNAEGERRLSSSEGKGCGAVGITSRISEEERAKGKSKGQDESLMKKIKCEMEDKREKRLSPDESKGCNTVGIKSRISEEKRAKGKREGQEELLTKKIKCEMEDEREKRLSSNESKGNAACLGSGHSKTEKTGKKHKRCSEEEFEGIRKRRKISLAWDVKGNETDTQEGTKEINDQKALHSDVFGNQFEGTVSEWGKREDPKKTKPASARYEYKMQDQQHNWISRCKSEIMEQSECCQVEGVPENCRHAKDRKNPSLCIEDDVERSFQSAHRRSRKGTPCRRRRDGSAKCTEKRDEMTVEDGVEIHGVLNKRSLNNTRCHNWLEKTDLEYRNKMMTTEPEWETWKVPQDEHAKFHCRQDVQEVVPQLPGSLGEEQMIPEHLNIYARDRQDCQKIASFKDVGKQRNKQKCTSPGHHLTADHILKRGGMKFADPRLRGDATRRPILSDERERCAQGETGAFTMRRGMTNGLGRGIPFYSPGRFKQVNCNEMFWLHKPTRPCMIEDGKRQLVPEINHRYPSVSSVQLPRLSYPWRYIGNIPSVMYPAQLNYYESRHALTGDRFGEDHPLGQSGDFYAQALAFQKSSSSNSQSSTSEEDDSERMGQGQQERQHVIKQENERKEQTYPRALAFQKCCSSDSQSSTSEEDDSERMYQGQQERQHVTKQENERKELLSPSQPLSLLSFPVSVTAPVPVSLTAYVQPLSLSMSQPLPLSLFLLTAPAPLSFPVPVTAPVPVSLIAHVQPLSLSMSQPLSLLLSLPLGSPYHCPCHSPCPCCYRCPWAAPVTVHVTAPVPVAIAALGQPLLLSMSQPLSLLLSLPLGSPYHCPCHSPCPCCYRCPWAAPVTVHVTAPVPVAIAALGQPLSLSTSQPLSLLLSLPFGSPCYCPCHSPCAAPVPVAIAAFFPLIVAATVSVHTPATVPVLVLVPFPLPFPFPCSCLCSSPVTAPTTIPDPGTAPAPVPVPLPFPCSCLCSSPVTAPATIPDRARVPIPDPGTAPAPVPAL